MLPTSTGLIVIALGIWCQFGTFRRTIITMFVLTLFESADAADLTALGGASITPAKLFLAFFVLRIVSMRDGVPALVNELAPRRVLFIYLLLLVWVVASGVFFPRLFAGTTDVFSLDRSTFDIGAVPLKPSSGNITQGVYAIGSFVIALGFAALGRKRGAYRAILTGILVATGLDIGFALLDVATAATHTGFLLDPIHSGNYAFLTSDESGSLKRISATFSEASAFATFSLELLAVNFSLFLARVRPRLTAFYSAALFALLFLSTSSTAYVGLAALTMSFAVYAVAVFVLRRRAAPLRILVFAAAGAIFAVCATILFAPGFAEATWHLLDLNVFQKAQTESAQERGELNTQAAKIFFDTYGLGAGIGSTRTSNYILVLASNLGVVGLGLFALLIGALAILRLRSDLAVEDRSIVAATRVGMLASLIPATLIGTIFDLGPLFYIFVGVVASSAADPVAEPTRQRSAARANRGAVPA